MSKENNNKRKKPEDEKTVVILKKKATKEKEEEKLDKIPIGNNRFVSLSNFKGVLYVDIREFYEDKESGELKPGKKGMKTSLNIGEGVALTVEQWEVLKKNAAEIDKLLPSK